MTNTGTRDSITLTIRERASMESTLDDAVRILRPEAMARRHGLMVTRSGPHTFTVSLDQDVPYGTTRERTAWK